MAEACSTNIRQRIRRTLERLDALDREKSALQVEFDQLQERLQTEERQEATRNVQAASHARFSPEEKIRIFMSLFRGREDVFPKRWDNAKTEKSGYAPACRNEWMKGACGKPQIGLFFVHTESHHPSRHCERSVAVQSPMGKPEFLDPGLQRSVAPRKDDGG